jgi:hypothetical protein
MKRSLHRGLVPFAAGAAANGTLARMTIRRREAREAGLRHALRATGNVAFATLALPLALTGHLPPQGPRLLWQVFLGAHAVHATLIVRLGRRHDTTRPFSRVSIVGGTIGYTTVIALSATAIAPGPPPRERSRRRLQRAGHNVLLTLHAFTITHGYFAKGHNATAYAPLAALWLAAARGLDRTWRT